MSDLQSVIDGQAWQWRQRLIEYIAPRLNCSDDEKLTVFDMIWAAVGAGHDEGMADAVDLVSRLKLGGISASDMRVVFIIEQALAELRRRNAKSADELLIDKEVEA